MYCGVLYVRGERDADWIWKPSHHIPYLYSLAGAASKSQERIREVAKDNYNSSVNGLSGVRSLSSAPLRPVPRCSD